MGSSPSPTATRRVRDTYKGLEGLNTAADAVEAILAMPGWAVLMELLEVERVAVEQKLERGLTPLSQAEYAIVHGRLGGIKTVQEQAQALLARRAAAMEEQARKHEAGHEPAGEE